MAALFFSYSHKDESLRNELEVHLAMLKREGLISAWHDRRIEAGEHIHDSISSALESADIILLLVSAHFLASDYCFEVEMQRALQKHNEGTARVIPIIIHPCDWQSSPFGNLNATPPDGKAVSMYSNQNEALALIAKDVRQVAESYTGTSLSKKKTNNPKSSSDLRKRILDELALVDSLNRRGLDIKDLSQNLKVDERDIAAGIQSLKEENRIYVFHRINDTELYSLS